HPPPPPDHRQTQLALSSSKAKAVDSPSAQPKTGQEEKSRRKRKEQEEKKEDAERPSQRCYGITERGVKKEEDQSSRFKIATIFCFSLYALAPRLPRLRGRGSGQEKGDSCRYLVGGIQCVVCVTV